MNDMDYEQIMRWSITIVRVCRSATRNFYESLSRTKIRVHLRLSAQCTVDVKVQIENSCYFGPPKPAHQSKIHVKKIKTIYKNQCQAPPTNQDNFAVSASREYSCSSRPKPTSNPTNPSKQYCAYPPAEDPPHTIHKDKSCQYDPQQSQMQRHRKKKRTSKESQSLVDALQH